MRKNKIGSLFLISVLAIAGIGVSYAGFSDSISVYGTVNTATVNLEVEDWYSGTWVWKVWGDSAPAGEIYIYQGWVGKQPKTEAEVLAITGGEYAELVSWSYAGVGTHIWPDQTTSDVDMVYHNLFPCIDFEADFIVHYTGTIPVIVNVAEIFPITQDNGFLTFLWNYHLTNPGYGAWVEAYRAYPVYQTPGDPTTPIVDWTYGEPVNVGYQLHNCNYVYVKLVIHLPQDNTLQGLTGTFGGNIGVIQWNDDCENGSPVIG